MEVRVRSHVRRHPRGTRPSRPLGTRGSLGAAIDDVVSGRASGYTWTAQWRFNIDEPEQMKRIYDMLGNRTLYAVATTNLTLAEREASPGGRLGFDPLIDANHGISLWRRADGTVFMDNIIVFVGSEIREGWVLDFAKSKNQQVIIKVDGQHRTYEFVDVPGWKVVVKGSGPERTFEPVKK